MISTAVISMLSSQSVNTSEILKVCHSIAKANKAWSQKKKKKKKASQLVLERKSTSVGIYQKCPAHWSVLAVVIILLL